MLDLKSCIGKRLEVEQINSLNEKIGNTYTSQILDHVDSNTIIIAAPSFESKLMFLALNQKIRLIFVYKTIGLVAVTGQVVARQKIDNIYSMKIQVDKGYEKIQRRQYFRLECALDAMYYIKDEKKDESQINQKKGIIKDISGNGLGLVTGEKLEKGNKLCLIFNLSGSDLKITAKVIRCTKIENNDKLYNSGLQFSKLTKRDEDIIIKYIFQQQRKLLRKT